MKIKFFLLVASVILSFAVTGHAQGSSTAPQTSVAATNQSQEPFTSDTPDLIRETQLGVRRSGYSGLVWWIPFEFWKKSAEERGVPPEKTEQTFGKLRDYTLICIFAAKVSPLGAFDFFSADDIQKNVSLRDASGKDYAFIKEPSQDAQNLAAIIKPLLSAAIGKAGENMQILFFPSRGKDGALIADAVHKGQFSVIIKNLLGEPDSVYLWRLPLTSLLPAKYCPVGKERVNLNWEYCPWHGVALNSNSTQ